MNATVAIVIPLYKPELSDLEKVSLKQCFKVLGAHKIVAVKPDNLILDGYEFSFDEEVNFDTAYFEDIAGYNRLLLSKEFYQSFLEYNYILIYQPDAFVFKDDLFKWCNLGYDYIGAPWLKRGGYPDIFKMVKNITLSYLHVKRNIKQPDSDLPTDLQLENRVGNGGFSLRNTKKFYEICSKQRSSIEYYNSKADHYFNEDVYWSLEANRPKRQLNIPDYKKAANFSIENNCEYALKLTRGKLPFGCHAWDKNLDFWRPIFKTLDINV